MPTLASIDRAAEKTRLTAEEFLDWLEPKVRADLIDGEILMHSPVNFRHATLLNFVDRLLAAYIEHHDLGRLDRENIAVKLDARDVFIPDLCFFTKEQTQRLLPTHATFPPALIVEALSPSTAGRDLGVKFDAYERYGAREYWVLNPQQRDHRFYTLEGKSFVEFDREEECVRSRFVPGFFLLRAWLDPVTPPTVASCLHEILQAPL